MLTLSSCLCIIGSSHSKGTCSDFPHPPSSGGGWITSQGWESKGQWSVLLKGVRRSLQPVPWLIPSAVPPAYHALWVGELEGSFGVLSSVDARVSPGL